MISSSTHRRRARPVHLAALLFSAAAITTAGPAFSAPTARECATANEDALALRKQDKLGAAKQRLLVCTDPACPAEIRDACAHELSQIEDAMPTVVFEVKDAAGNDESAVRVTMDGAPLVDHVGADAVGVDPGQHVFHFESATQSVEKTVIVRDGEKNREIAVTLGAGGTSAPAGATGTAGGPAQPERGSSSLGTQKTLALVAGGVGVVGIGLGAAFGAMAMSSWNQAKTDCGPGCPATSPAQSEKNTASSQATLSTVGFVGGGLLAGAAAVLWFTAPSGASVQVGPSVGVGGPAITIRGTF